MKISLKWLKEYIEVKDKPEVLSETLTQTGLEVEGIEKYESVEGGLEGMVIGNVLTCEKHPNADKLKITTVDVGEQETLPIVCGAPNIAAGQQVVVAKVGSTLYPKGSEPFKIKKTKIRGELSMGMICAEDEIGLGDSHDGIMVLETDLKPGTPASEYFKLENDYIIEIGLTPNRGDAISHIGVARDLKAVFDKSIKWPSVDQFKIDNTARSIRVEVENREACPRYSGVTVSNISVKPSPDWLQVRLRSIGLTPINAVVDVTNFVCHEIGQPLHAFDADRITGHKIIVKTQAEGTGFVTLDGKERRLAADDLMICNEKEGMCIAGVFGGIKSGVTDTTSNIFIEGAYFSPDYIRKTSVTHGLKTDASFRFERGTDPRITIYAVKRAALLIKDICGGDISSEIVDVYPEPVEDTSIKVKFSHINRLIGKEIDQATIFKILENLDIKTDNREDESFIALVPPYRVDVKREADIVEEILRIYGFNNVELPDYIGTDYLSEFPVIDREQVQFRTSEMLASMGFNEIITNSLTKPSYAVNADFIDETKHVEILNKLSEDLGVLRQDMVFTGLESLAYNINRKQKNLKFFEFGKSYFKSEKGYGEKTGLSLLLTGMVEDENWINKARQLEFYDLSSVVAKILNKFSITNTDSKAIYDGLFAFGLQISVGGREIVAFGKLSEDVTGQADIQEEVWYAIFNWEYLLKQSDKRVNYQEISKFPEVRRDLSLVLDKKIGFDKIRQIAEKSESRLLRDISVFDVYEGENVGTGKKAYAIKFILQDHHQTLTDKTIDKTMDRLMKSFEKELGAIIRK
ncbi:MAG: phenylalanine--tRNA ligase subunit beta [Cytophagales bacterium]|nr:phenylalanine--tRNA ligase subunit beta [Cytophagales bacterium]